MAVKPVPEGYQTVTPYLTLQNPEAVMDFLKRTFDTQEIEAMRDEQGKVRHAEMKVGTSVLMFGRARDQWTPRPATFYVYVADCDAVYKKALAAGGKSITEPTNQFYGDRHAAVSDSEGNQWWIATHVEDVPPEEMDRRAREWYQKQAAPAQK